MRMEWTPEQDRLRHEYEELARSTVALRAAECYQAGTLDHHSWETLTECGFWRLAVPAKYGGAGTSYWDFVAALEGLASGAGDLGFLLSVIAHSGTLRGLVEFGTDCQRRRHLEPLMAKAIASTAITEASGGSDVARIRTGAVAVANGYAITGQKCHITNAPIADIALLLARVAGLGRRDITIFVIERTTPGIEMGPPEPMLGNRTSPTGSITLQNAVIAADEILGSIGNGLEPMYSVISHDRVLYGIVAAAFIDPLVDQVLRFVEQRQAFRSPIAEHQYVQGRVTDLVILRDTIRWVSYGALGRLLTGHPEASASCSVAKLAACEGLCQATQHVMAIFGHIGYMAGPISRAAADALGTRIAGGTAEMQRKNIFHQVVGRPAKAQEATCHTGFAQT